MTQQSTIRRPSPDEYFEFYRKYVDQVPDGDLLTQMDAHVPELRSFFSNVAESDAVICHAPYTWTIKQVVGHMIDSERVFAERLHRFASGDLQPVPGIDQDIYVAGNDYETPALQSLVEELLLCRQANVLLVRRIKPQAWDNRGIASDHPVTVRAQAWILVGHINHHMRIVRQRLGRLKVG
ncbi:MAG: DinB family protein [Fuerstia sp.]|nr:DinB family protein [Fuerstiella sp.]